MKVFSAILVIFFGQSLQAEELSQSEVFSNRIYTPEVVVDKNNSGPKGAVQLLWQKSDEGIRYEVEVSNGNSTYSSVNERNFQHLMLYFGKDYQWRVREVGAQRTTEFSAWRPVKVVKYQNEMADQREMASDEDHYYLDAGAQSP